MGMGKLAFYHADSGQNPDPGRLRSHWDGDNSGKVVMINGYWVVSKVFGCG